MLSIKNNAAFAILCNLIIVNIIFSLEFYCGETKWGKMIVQRTETKKGLFHGETEVRKT